VAIQTWNQLQKGGVALVLIIAAGQRFVNWLQKLLQSAYIDRLELWF
jgi:hypothetical protein